MRWKKPAFLAGFGMGKNKALLACGCIAMGLFISASFSPARGATTAEVVARLQDIAPAERQAFLERGAKKEAAFVFYGTMSTDHATRLLAGFRQRYPSLTVRHYRAGSTALLSKI